MLQNEDEASKPIKQELAYSVDPIPPPPNIIPFDDIPEHGRYNLRKQNVSGTTAPAGILTASRLGQLHVNHADKVIRPTAITLPTRSKAMKALLSIEPIPITNKECFFMMDEELDTIYYREGQHNYWQEYANCKMSEDQMSHVLHYVMTQYRQR